MTYDEAVARARQLWGVKAVVSNARGKALKKHPDVGEAEWDVTVYDHPFGQYDRVILAEHELDTEGHITCHAACSELEATADGGSSGF